MVSTYTASVYLYLGPFVYTTSSNNISRPFSKKSSLRRNFEFLIKTPLEKMLNFLLVSTVFKSHFYRVESHFCISEHP